MTVARNARRMAGGAIVLALSALFVWMIAARIYVVAEDVGRHLANGKNILESGEPIRTNFYSAQHANFPVINHHWGSGVVFFLVERAAGYEGLNLFYIAGCLAAFWILFDAARQRSDFGMAALCGILLIPMLTFRRSVRPEMFSYLLFSLSWWLIAAARSGRIARGGLYALPAITALWVNLHIYFVLVYLLLGLVFLDDAWAGRRGAERSGASGQPGFWLALAAACALATLVNPNGWRGAVYPLRIFGNFGLPVIENQPATAFVGQPAAFQVLFPMVTSTVALALACAWGASRRRLGAMRWKLAAAWILMIFAWLVARNMTLAGFCLLPVLAELMGPIAGVSNALPRRCPRRLAAAILVLTCVAPTGLFVARAHAARSANFGFGLVPGVRDAVVFFREHGLEGPIFNNFDIGSHLIYELFPRERVFVDNRPEAYPEAFFRDVYLPALRDPGAWSRVQADYRFNAIILHYPEIDPLDNPFLRARVLDPEWAPVFGNAYTVIFLRRTAQNEALIRRYERRDYREALGE